MSLLRRFRCLGPPLRAERARIVAGLLCLPLHAAVVLLLPQFIGSVIDQFAGSPRPDTWVPTGLESACLIMAGLAVTEALLRYGSRRWIIDASRNAEERLKNSVAAHLLSLPVPWFDRARTGDLVSRMTQDIELLRFLVGPVILHGGSALFVLPGGIAWMLWTSGTVTLATLSAFVVMMIGLRYFATRIHRVGEKVQKDIGAMSQRIHEGFAGSRTIRTFGAQAREQAQLARLNRRYLVHNLHLTRLRAWVNVLLHSVSNLVILAVLVVGGMAVLDGDLTAGELFQFLIYLGLMMWPLQAIGWSIGTVPRALAAADRLQEVLDVAPEPVLSGQAPLTGPGLIEFRSLTFCYPEQSEPALRDLSFVLEPHQSLGIAGPVGSGKSTILALLLRLYDPPPGTILIDGIDILELDPRALRQRFALAAQDPFLFSDTIQANVALGSGEVAVAEDHILDAITAAALEQDLDQLESGVGTIVGERGVTLSGGQRQRVSLARALAASRHTLMLDDTLSAVDVETERRILDRLAQRQGSSAIVVSHRLSAVKECDLVLVLDGGRLTELGRHEELVAADGIYAHAWRLQTEARTLGGEP